MFEDSYRQKGLRNGLIDILKQKGIQNNDVLEAMRKIPRHIFFDSAFLTHAYQDKAFPIGDGQTISQPYTVALQTELSNVKSGDKVLEIGTGSGYQACVLAELNANLFTVEQSLYHFKKSSSYFQYLKYKNIRSFHGDGSKGLPGHAPFDRVIVTAGAPIIPKDLLDQLVVGGVLVIPVGKFDKQEMIRLTKVSETKITKENFGDCAFVPLVGNNGWQ